MRLILLLTIFLCGCGSGQEAGLALQKLYDDCEGVTKVETNLNFLLGNTVTVSCTETKEQRK